MTIKILSGATVVSTVNIASPNPGTLMGLNTVSLTAPGTVGTYSVSITAGSTGYPTWQQITPLTANYVAVFPQGLAVDNNVNSPYYGRVVVGCAAAATAHGVAQNCGLYKYNADGTPADEGSFGYANYTTNDAGITDVGQMPSATFAGFAQIKNPSTIRIGEDDRIYWQDNSDGGAIIACDMLATTNQVIICSQNSPSVDKPSFLTGPQYGNCPSIGVVNSSSFGWVQFDIINVGTASSYTGANGVYTGGQAALFLSDWDFACAGVWMWHMVGTPGSMTVDPTDTYGEQVVGAALADTIALRTDGVAVDYNLDVFVGQNRSAIGSSFVKTASWAKWNGGILPPGNQNGADPGGGFGYSLIANPTWAEGAGSTTTNDNSIFDMVLDSKTNPHLLARAHLGGPGYGIDLLVPSNPTITITSVSLSGTTLTINCTSSNPYAPDLSQISLVNSSTADGTYAPVAATFTGGNGVFQATTTISGPMGFYKVASSAVGGSVVSGSAVTISASGNVTSTLAYIDSVSADGTLNDVYRSGIAFDNVGNLYGANPSDNYWRVWSPPGANTNTTKAVVTLTAN
ncbi:MAG TPA: hypothetical protein VFC07_14005 [Verrucomicrobiae bacterium]|nr:hypothetical protein [Verrucomicrobiae bacterium]